MGTTEDGTELCFVMGWNDGYEEDEEDTMYQQDGYTLCSKIGYKHSNLMVMDYSDFNMPYDKKTADVWDTDMSVGKGEVTDDAFDVKWYNDEAEAIWKKYGTPDKEGTTALDLMESKTKESLVKKGEFKFKCSMAKKKESLGNKREDKLYMGCHGYFTKDGRFYVIEDESSEWNGEIVGKWSKSDWSSLDTDKIIIEWRKDHPTKSFGGSAESTKNESAYGTVRVDSEDIAIKVQESNVYPSSSGRSLSVEVPKVEAWFSTLSEFSDCIDGIAEDCNGYPDISRDGSDILVQINAPKEDENGEFNGDYEVIAELRCSTEITSTSLEGVVDLLNHD